MIQNLNALKPSNYTYLNSNSNIHTLEEAKL